jgi:hypothetical protein
MNLTIEPLGKSLLPNDIAEFEQSLGFPLPQGYRAFLEKFNGGKSYSHVFEYFSHSGDIHDSVIQVFFGIINPDYLYDLRFQKRASTGRIPDSLLPIATDVYGNKICLGIQGEKRGQVYFWNHELEFDNEDGSLGNPSYDNVFFVANDFVEFIASLRPMREDV